MSNKHGEVSWGGSDAGGGEKKNTKDMWLRLSPGSNLVRILTLPYQYYQHRYEIEGGKKYGYRVNCSMANGSCELCDKDNKPKRRWLLGVIDRKTNMFRMLDVGYGVFGNIKTYAQDEDWGDPSQYDIDIICNPNGSPQEYYKCVCKPKKPLSANDLDIRERANLDDLVRLSAASTVEKVKERLEFIYKEINASGHTVSKDSETEDEPEFKFKDYDAKSTNPF
jgi:hypothetical protein